MKTIHQVAIERIVYFIGKLVPKSNAIVLFREKGFLYGVGAIDMARTIRRRIFRLDERLKRFYAILRGRRLDTVMPLPKINSIMEQVHEQNNSQIGKTDDFWIAQRVSGRIRRIEGGDWEINGPAAIADCRHKPITARAAYFRDIIPVNTPSARRAPPNSIRHCTKSRNEPNLKLADRELQFLNPRSRAIQLNENENLCEEMGGNISIACPKEGIGKGRGSQFNAIWGPSRKFGVVNVLRSRKLKSAETFLNALSSSVEINPGDRINYH